MLQCVYLCVCVLCVRVCVCARVCSCVCVCVYVEFSRPGVVDISVQMMREQQPLFPRIPVAVQSQLEAMYSTLCPDKGQDEESVADNSLAILAALLAYIANSEENAHGTEYVDRLLHKVLHSVSPDHLSDWHFGPFLCGEWVWSCSRCGEWVWSVRVGWE